MGEFGDKFRKARESKELSLDDVSSVTKINARMLQAIEEEHFDRLPGGVFNKGFIRAYAKHLGLNPEDAVSDYLACLRQAQIDAHEVWQPEGVAPASVQPAPELHTLIDPPNKAAVKPQAPVQVEELPDLQLPRAGDVRPHRGDYPQRLATGIPWKLLAGAALIVILALLLWTPRSHAPQAASAKSAPAPPVATSPAPSMASVEPSTRPQAATRPPQPTQPSASDTAAPQPAKPSPESPKPSPAAQASTSTPAPTSVSASAPASTSTAAPATDADSAQEKIVEKGDVTIRSFGQPTTTSAAKSASLSLVIRATETSWISVTSDGQLVTQETLIAPANTTVHASREIVVRVGNAAGVTFLWNGEEISPQGAEAETKALVFDQDGMRALSSQAPQ